MVFYFSAKNRSKIALFADFLDIFLSKLATFSDKIKLFSRKI